MENKISDSKKNILVTLADKNYLDFAKQLFSSIYFNSGWQGDYMLLAYEIPEDDLKWFIDKGILVKRCKPLAEKLAGRWSPVILSNFYLFTEEFKKWNKIIFFDADLIVNCSLDVFLDTNKMSALGNFSYPSFKQTKLKHFFKFYKLRQASQLRDLKVFGRNLPILSSGFFIIDTDIITNQTFEDLKQLFYKYQNDVGGIDELVLSMYFAGQWDSLSPIYCLHHNHLIDYQIKLNGIKSVTTHFISHQKSLDYCGSIYNTWKNNLNKADLIDLNNRLDPVAIWSRSDMKKNYYRLIMRTMPIRLRLLLNKISGMFGIILKKLLPSLYYFLIKFKNKI